MKINNPNNNLSFSSVSVDKKQVAKYGSGFAQELADALPEIKKAARNSVNTKITVKEKIHTNSNGEKSKMPFLQIFTKTRRSFDVFGGFLIRNGVADAEVPLKDINKRNIQETAIDTIRNAREDFKKAFVEFNGSIKERAPKNREQQKPKRILDSIG
jgi:hypothetical protein